MKTVTINNGERFGRLVVIKEVEPRLQYKKGKVRRFLCQCDCGNMTTVDLIHGRIKSCGCYKKEQLKAAIVCCHLDFAEVHPLTWQSRLGLRLKGMEKAERKREYKCAAQALYPGTTPTLKTADAILIMHFGRKIFDDKKWINKNINQAKRNLL